MDAVRRGELPDLAALARIDGVADSQPSTLRTKFRYAALGLTGLTLRTKLPAHSFRRFGGADSQAPGP